MYNIFLYFGAGGDMCQRLRQGEGCRWCAKQRKMSLMVFERRERKSLMASLATDADASSQSTFNVKCLNKLAKLGIREIGCCRI